MTNLHRLISWKFNNYFILIFLRWMSLHFKKGVYLWNYLVYSLLCHLATEHTIPLMVWVHSNTAHISIYRQNPDLKDKEMWNLMLSANKGILRRTVDDLIKDFSMKCYTCTLAFLGISPGLKDPYHLTS